MEKFNSVTKDKYSFLACKGVEVLTAEKLVRVIFVYPEDISPDKIDFFEIKKATEKVLETPLAVDVRLVASHLDKDHFIKGFCLFIKEFPLLYTSIKPRDIAVDEKDNIITISIDSDFFSYIQEREIEKKTRAFIKKNYTQDIRVIFKPEIKDPEEEEEAETVTLEREGGRFIEVENKTIVVGKPIYSKPSYIIDMNQEKEEVTLCGELLTLEELEYSCKRTNQKKAYCVFDIKDFSSKISCVYFPYKGKSGALKDFSRGETVLVRGRLSYSKRFPGMLQLTVRDMAKCSVSGTVKENRILRAVPKNYKVVFPKPFISTQQDSFFGKEDLEKDNFQKADSHLAFNSNSPELLEKSFVVFDVETTGLDCKIDKIIEIGAVKIENGVITESFSTLIDPKIAIPFEATRVNGITNEMVKNMPTIKEAIIDFRKFVDGSVLIAHNFGFDHGFISAAGRPLGVYFENESLCTLALSKEKIKGLKSYSLSAVAKHFSIHIQNAHRAQDDALAAAQIFLRLV